MDKMIYFVPIVDVSWVNLGALNPRKNFIAEPPPMELCNEEAEGIIDLMKELYDGKFAYSVYTGTYCRDGFTQETFIKTWKRAIAQGGEILIHTHEEIARVGTRNGEKDHMYEVIRRQYNNFINADIVPVGFRGGLYGYANFLTPLLEELNLNIEFSAAPGINKPDREAVWTGIPHSAFYLCKNDKLHVNCEHEKSKILEIPIGADGLGTENQNYLYIDYDLSDLEGAKRIWNSLLERVLKDDKPYMIHTLFHTFSMSNPRMVERYRRFTDFILNNGGYPVVPSEAKTIFDKDMVK